MESTIIIFNRKLNDASTVLFSYFFELEEFNKTIRPFGLSSYVQFDNKGFTTSLIIIKCKSFQLLKSKENLLAIPFGVTMMVHEKKLWYWNTDYNSIDLYEVNLLGLETGKEVLHDHIPLDLSSYLYESASGIEISRFVTYVRLKEMKYDLDFYDQFAIIMIDGKVLNVVPFDTFNFKGGDYGYVWPALARFDLSTLKIYGSGMRMDDFIIDLKKT